MHACSSSSFALALPLCNSLDLILHRLVGKAHHTHVELGLIEAPAPIPGCILDLLIPQESWP